MKLTGEQIEAYVAFVTEHGQKRAQEQGDEFSEVDFLCGAMCVFFAFDQNGSVPAGWIFGPMSGRAVLRSEEAAKRYRERLELDRDLREKPADQERCLKELRRVQARLENIVGHIAEFDS